MLRGLQDPQKERRRISKDHGEGQTCLAGPLFITAVPLHNLYNQAGVSNLPAPPIASGGWAKFDHLKECKPEGDGDDRGGRGGEEEGGGGPIRAWAPSTYCKRTHGREQQPGRTRVRVSAPVRRRGIALNSRCSGQQQAAAAPPPSSLQIRPTDFLTFVVVHPCKEGDDGTSVVGQMVPSTWPEVGREMTPQLDTAARSLISEPALTPTSSHSVFRASCHRCTPILMVSDQPPPPSVDGQATGSVQLPSSPPLPASPGLSLDTGEPGGVGV